MGSYQANGFSPKESPIPLNATLVQALALEPAAARGFSLLNYKIRFRLLRAQAQESPAHAAENAERARARHAFIGNGGIFIPESSITRFVYLPDGTEKEYGNFGVLAQAQDHPLLEETATQAQKRYLQLLDEVVLERLSRTPSEEIKVELAAMRKGLVAIHPAAFHLTIAGIRRGETFHPNSWRFRHLRRNILKRTREIAQVSREIILKFSGDVTYLHADKGTHAITLHLTPDTPKDLLRLQTYKYAYGARLPFKTLEAHISLFLVKGWWNPALEDWTVTREQQDCLTEAGERLQGELTSFKKSPITWRVNQFEVMASEKLDSPGNEEGTPVPLIPKEDYEKAVASGEQTLMDAWQRLRKTDEPLSWNAVEATLGLFWIPLHNRRSLLAAIHKKAISAERVIWLVLHATKLVVREKYDPPTGVANYRIMAKYDRPGLMLAISRVIDQFGGNVDNIAFDHRRRGDARSARSAIELNMTGLSPAEAAALEKALAAIPDIGHHVLWIETFYNAWIHILDYFSGMTTIHLPPFELDARDRIAGQETRRSVMLQALMDLDSRCLVSNFSVDRRGKKVFIQMAVHVPRTVADRVEAELRHAAGLPDPLTPPAHGFWKRLKSWRFHIEISRSA